MRLQLLSDYGVELPARNLDKLAVAALLLTTDEFYNRLSRFITVCNVLSGAAFNPAVVDLADAEECAWGMTEALLISPPESDEPFSEEIRSYLGKILDSEGIVNPPDLLKIAIRGTDTGLPAYPDTSDADLFNASFDTQQARTQEIEANIRQNLQELFAQLAALELANGKTDDLASRARANLQT
jgi:hypothetical protein